MTFRDDDGGGGFPCASNLDRHCVEETRLESRGRSVTYARPGVTGDGGAGGVAELRTS